MRRKHHNLKLWQDSRALVKEVYEATGDFPREEIYGLTGQMRRAAVSIPSKIAEGAGRNGVREFIQFLSIARGSLSELETQVVLAQDLGYLDETSSLLERIGSVFSLAGGLLTSLQKRFSE
ncbi:hypothetical protein DESUT3_22510 [Desulfuromonas versatilis]|uniref:Four helix bundle protein n=1 Tax=Desulfuromonas versatilis TaxID=2802975 RepID=A0ABM8HWN1_9BACT|nr:four helix bundle protein [Desulfuromonas versatilis]BCR05182.1 hypothetical protein DESUT3_22510 [Desulfuromonas versatilis]